MCQVVQSNTGQNLCTHVLEVLLGDFCVVVLRVPWDDVLFAMVQSTRNLGAKYSSLMDIYKKRKLLRNSTSWLSVDSNDNSSKISIR